MPRPKKPFEQVKKEASADTLEFLRSRAPSVTLADVRAYWRMRGAGGMADNALAWLEQDGAVSILEDSGIVILREAMNVSA